jgi:hypothetical protein
MNTLRLRSASAFVGKDGRTIVVLQNWRVIQSEKGCARVTFSNAQRDRAIEKPSRKGLLSALGRRAAA